MDGAEQRETRHEQSATTSRAASSGNACLRPGVRPTHLKSQALAIRHGLARLPGSVAGCCWWHGTARLYALQLNVYRKILEDEYNFRVTLMLLGQVHPERNGPCVIRVPRMDEELQLIEEDQVARSLAWPEPRPGEDAKFELPARDGMTHPSIRESRA